MLADQLRNRWVPCSNSECTPEGWPSSTQVRTCRRKAVVKAPRGATVCGGEGNEARETRAVTVGGKNNIASGFDALAAGDGAAAEDSGALVFNDGGSYHSISTSSLDGLSSTKAVDGEPVTGTSTFSVSSRNGVRFITGSNSVTYIDGGTTGWGNTSSRAVKTDIEPVDTAAILDGVRDMEIAT